MFFKSLVLCHLTAAVDHIDFGKKHIHKLEATLNKLLRQLDNCRRLAHGLPVVRDRWETAEKIRRRYKIYTFDSIARVCRVKWLCGVFSDHPAIWTLITRRFSWERTSPITPHFRLWTRDCELLLANLDDGEIQKLKLHVANVGGEVGGDWASASSVEACVGAWELGNNVMSNLSRLLQNVDASSCLLVVCIISFVSSLPSSRRIIVFDFLRSYYAELDESQAVNCTVCSRTMNNPQALAYHMKRTHSISSTDYIQHLIDDVSLSTQSNICPLCSAPFVNRSTLVMHLHRRRTCKDAALWHYSQHDQLQNPHTQPIPLPVTLPSTRSRRRLSVVAEPLDNDRDVSS